MTLLWSDTMDGMDWEELAALYRAAPLGAKTAESLQITFSNSMYICVVRENGRLVGAGRVLADGYEVAYLADIALLPDYQGRGIGQEIVKRLLGLAGHHRKILLYSVPGKEPFYRKFGFRRLLTAMAVFSDLQEALRKGHIGED